MRYITISSTMTRAYMNRARCLPKSGNKGNPLSLYSKTPGSTVLQPATPGDPVVAATFQWDTSHLQAGGLECGQNWYWAVF